MRHKKTLIILLSIITLAAILRTYRINVRPLYEDELLSLRWSALKVTDYFKTMALKGDEKPLYYIILHLWRNYVSGSETGMKYLSVFAGVLSVAMIFMLAKTLTNIRIGLLSAFLLAISPVHIYYSQEIRMYELQLLFVLASFYFFWKLFTPAGKARIFRIGYILSSIISIHLHITSVLALLVHNIYFFLRRKDSSLSVKDWLITQLLIFILTPQIIIPILYIFGYRYGNWAGYSPALAEGIYSRFPIMDIPKTYSIFSIGFLVREWKGNLHILIPAFLLFFPPFILGVRKVLSSWRKSGYFLLLWCFVPVFTLFFLYVFLKNPFEYRSRYVLISSFAYYIIIAIGLESIRYRFFKLLLICGIIAFSLFSLCDYYNFKNLQTQLSPSPTSKKYCLLLRNDK